VLRFISASIRARRSASSRQALLALTASLLLFGAVFAVLLSRDASLLGFLLQPTLMSLPSPGASASACASTFASPGFDPLLLLPAKLP